jgi:hypothetical protein
MVPTTVPSRVKKPPKAYNVGDVGWFNIIGTPTLSLTAMTYILKKTLSKKFALWTITFIVFGLAVFFVTYIYSRFFLGLGGVSTLKRSFS